MKIGIDQIKDIQKLDFQVCCRSRLIKEGKQCLDWDCDWCELNSNINIFEVEGIISSEQAWYLREKYLGMKKEDNIG